MSGDRFAAWRSAVGYRSENLHTREWRDSTEEDAYARALWEAIADPDELPLSPQVARTRLSLVKQIQADLLELVKLAGTDGADGPSSHEQRSGKWCYPLARSSTQLPLGELRYPHEGCDEFGMHHRAYFAAPTNWPGSIIWSLAAFKPDKSVDPNWRSIQNRHIDCASRSAANYMKSQDSALRAVQARIPPKM